MLYDLNGRRVVVTGAGDGVGRRLALGMAGEGATIFAADINFERVEGTVREVGAAQGKAFAYQLDVSDPKACESFAAAIGSTHGPIDVLVNNAGIGRPHNIGDENFVSVWRELIEVNLSAVAYATMPFIEQLKKTRGSIVNIASLAVTQASNASPGYAASKAGVLMLTRTLARDLAPFGVRVNAVAPGMLKTQLTARARSDERLVNWVSERTMMKRLGEPEEILGPVTFLASEMASYVTGAILYVDGGASAL